MSEIDYLVHDLDEIRCDICNKLLCYGFLTDYLDSGFLCDICKNKKQIEQAPRVQKQKTEHENRERLERQCGESKEGHIWVNITHQTLVRGANIFSCTKCGATKQESYSFEGSLNFDQLKKEVK